MPFLIRILLAFIALPAWAEGPAIVVGAAVSETGALAPLAGDYRRGLLLWQDEVNGAGGLLGRHVELRLLDDESDARRSGELYAQLIGEKADLLIGPYGSAATLMAAAQTKPYFTDWRRQYSGAAECVVRPGSTDEVARVVALCARDGVAVVAQGGNTGLVGGSVPTGAQREIVLSLGRMNRIRAVDALNDTITVEAGCVLAAVP